MLELLNHPDIKKQIHALSEQIFSLAGRIAPDMSSRATDSGLFHRTDRIQFTYEEITHTLDIERNKETGAITEVKYMCARPESRFATLEYILQPGQQLTRLDWSNSMIFPKPFASPAERLQAHRDFIQAVEMFEIA